MSNDKCNHYFIRQDRGHIFTTYGEYNDDLEEDYLCVKCHRYLSEIEKGEAHRTETKNIEQPDGEINHTSKLDKKQGDNYD